VLGKCHPNVLGYCDVDHRLHTTTQPIPAGEFYGRLEEEEDFPRHKLSNDDLHGSDSSNYDSKARTWYV